MNPEARLDKWLWAVRLFKTRSLAAAACRNGLVLVQGQRVKPARTPQVNEVFTLRLGEIRRTVRVLGHPPGRVGAKLVAQFMEDLTPPEELEKARTPKPPPPFLWGKGLGRPTKKNRRLWEKLSSPDAEA